MNTIDLKETVALINKGQWLSLRVITADVLKGKGGSVLDLPRVRKAKFHNTLQTHGHVKAITTKRKNARHHVHFTINMELENGLIRKIHPPLITHINDKRVI